MNRLETLLTLDPQYAQDVIQFVSDNPEFAPFIEYVSFTRRSLCPVQQSIKELLTYYVCHAGVSVQQGQKYYNNPEERPLTKQQTISLINQLPDHMSREEVLQLKNKGRWRRGQKLCPRTRVSR